MRTQWTFFLLILFTSQAVRAGVDPVTQDFCARMLETTIASHLGVSLAQYQSAKALPLRQADTAVNDLLYIRANVHSFLDFLGRQALTELNTDQLQMFQRLIPFIGYVQMDFHHDNLTVGFINGHIDVFAIDVDDAGEGPFIENIMRFVTVAKVAEKFRGGDLIKVSDVMKAYRSGLEGNLYEPPDSWKKALAMSLKKYSEKQTDFLATRLETDGKIKPNPKKEVTALPRDEAYKALEGKLHRKFPQIKILDIAKRAKSSGGSLGAKRYWVSVEEADGSRALWEIKENLWPGSAVVHSQKSDQRRIRNFQEANWPGGYDPNFLVFRFQGFSFQKRPLQASLVPDPWDATEMSHQEFLKLTLFLASREGFNNARQKGPGELLAQAIHEMSKEDLDVLDSLVRKINKLYLSYLEDHRP